MAPLGEMEMPLAGLDQRDRLFLLQEEKDGLVIVGLWLFAEEDATSPWRLSRRRWIRRRWENVGRQIEEIDGELARL